MYLLYTNSGVYRQLEEDPYSTVLASPVYYDEHKNAVVKLVYLSKIYYIKSNTDTVSNTQPIEIYNQGCEDVIICH